MLIEQVPDRLWGTTCVTCPLTITREDAEKDDVTLTFFRGEWRLIHTRCFENWLNE